MITCEHARQLFDRYLDGELSPSLQAELHAHRLSCSLCQSELAMLEACGDVILLDRSEPTVSASFTDRVMSAYVSRRAHQPRRRLVRAAMMVASPMAAAASLLLAVVLVTPDTPQPPSLVAGDSASVPEFLRNMAGDPSPGEAAEEIKVIPQMPAAGFMQAWITEVDGWTDDTLSRARAGFDELKLLLHEARRDTHDQLVAGYRSAPESETATQDDAIEGTLPAWDLPGTLWSPSEPSDEASQGLLLDQPL